MQAKEVPVEGVERASFWAFPLLGVKAAGGAVITHFILVGGPCGIRFCGEEAPIGKEDHAKDVGNHDPVVGVEVHLRVPSEDGLGFVAAEKKKVSQNHETLDVVIVSMIDGAMNGLGDAAHVGFSRVGPTGKGASGFEKVHRAHLGHLEPVDSVDKFTPTEDLADKSLDGVKRGFALAVGFFRGRDALLGGEES